jgi:hypothetical protein
MQLILFAKWLKYIITNILVDNINMSQQKKYITKESIQESHRIVMEMEKNTTILGGQYDHTGDQCDHNWKELRSSDSGELKLCDFCDKCGERR